jgi:hypothetical protein
MSEIKRDKVTRAELKTMTVGEARTYQLPNAAACDSAKSTAYQMQNLMKCRFSQITDYATNQITITRSL